MSPRRPCRTPAVGLALLATVCTAACGTSTDEATAPAPSPSASATAPVTTQETVAPQDAAIAAARELIPRYFQVSERALSEPKSFDPAGFEAVAISTGLTEMKNQLTAYKAQGIRITGAGTVVSIENPRVDLKNNPKASPPDIPTVQIDVCYDVSKVVGVDRDGKPVPPNKTRAPRVLKLMGVSNYSYPEADEWRVSYTQNQEGKTC